VAPARIAPTLDELEDSHAGLRPGAELPPVEQRVPEAPRRKKVSFSIVEKQNILSMTLGGRNT
jgi:hypothetical protein